MNPVRDYQNKEELQREQISNGVNPIRNSVRVHIFVSGRVQGVFFRSETQRKARQFGITGFVRNLLDGRVEAILEGEREKVEKVIKWARRGPFFARVEKMEANWEKYRREFKEFEIKY